MRFWYLSIRHSQLSKFTIQGYNNLAYKSVSIVPKWIYKLRAIPNKIIAVVLETWKMLFKNMY